MLEAYSLNIEVDTNTAIPFNSVSIDKSCDEGLVSATTIELNKKGVYLVSVDASLAAAASIQLFKDGVAQEQAQSTGTNPGFVTLVQASRNNCGCCACSPVTIQVKNTGDAAATFTNCKVTVIKLPCGGGI